MKAIAVYPGKPNSMHLEEIPMPRVTDIPGGCGVLVKVLRVGVDGTDKEINAAEYGAAPSGYDFLVIGHEAFGAFDGLGDVRRIRMEHGTVQREAGPVQAVFRVVDGDGRHQLVRVHVVETMRHRTHRCDAGQAEAENDQAEQGHGGQEAGAERESAEHVNAMVRAPSWPRPVYQSKVRPPLRAARGVCTASCTNILALLPDGNPGAVFSRCG